MRSTQWLETELPVMPGRQFQLNFHDAEGNNHDWQGPVWDIATQATTLIVRQMSEENGLQKAKRWLGGGSSITLLEAKGPLDDPSYEEITIFPSATDIMNAYRAFFQSDPGAAWLLLKARLMTEEQTPLTIKRVEAYILANKQIDL